MARPPTTHPLPSTQCPPSRRFCFCGVVVGGTGGMGHSPFTPKLGKLSPPYGSPQARCWESSGSSILADRCLLSVLFRVNSPLGSCQGILAFAEVVTLPMLSGALPDRSFLGGGVMVPVCLQGQSSLSKN